MMRMFTIVLTFGFVCSATSTDNYFIITNEVISTKEVIGTLDNLINDLIDMVPIDKIYAEAAFSFLWDSEVKNSYKYLKSAEFYNLVDNLQDHNEYVQLLKYLEDNGLNVPHYFDLLRKYINLPPYTKFRKFRIFPSGGVDGLLKRIVHKLPLNKMHTYFNDQVETEEELKKSIRNIYSDEFIGMCATIKKLPEYVTLQHSLQLNGINIENYLIQVYGFFNINVT